MFGSMQPSTPSVMTSMITPFLQALAMKNNPEYQVFNKMYDRDLQQSLTALDAHIERAKCQKCPDADDVDDLCLRGKKAAKLDDRVLDLK